MNSATLPLSALSPILSTTLLSSACKLDFPFRD
jgi:hypothetical protein